jgi:hypothetical protein
MTTPPRQSYNPNPSPFATAAHASTATNVGMALNANPVCVKTNCQCDINNLINFVSRMNEVTRIEFDYIATQLRNDISKLKNDISHANNLLKEMKEDNDEIKAILAMLSLKG